MIFQQLFDPKSSTYTYVIAAGVGGEAMIVDPVFEQVDSYLTLLRRLRLRLVKAIDTHVHADHITALGALRDITHCMTVMGKRSSADAVAMRVPEGDTIAVDGVSMRAMYTPGHTDDSYCFVMNDRVLTGDTLLIGGTGRTDFQNGDSRAAYHSLFDKVLSLPGDTLVFPAHDYHGNSVSTIGYEKEKNPRLQVTSAGEYAELMAGLDLPNPKMMDVAVPANRHIGIQQRKYIEAGQALEAGEVVRRARERDMMFVDLREESERRRDGVIPGSVPISYDHLVGALESDGQLSDRLRKEPDDVIFYCAFGERSATALELAREHGFSGAHHMLGGLGAWSRAGGPVSFEPSAGAD